MDLSSRFPPFVRDLLREAKADDLTGLAAELAFRFFLSLFPFVLVLVTLGAFVSGWAGVDDPSGEILDAVGDSLPADASSVLRNQVDEVVEGKNLGLLSIGLATALWSAAGAAGAVMKATNRVYDLPESRRTPVKLALALGLTLLGGLGLVAAVALMVVSQAFAGSIASGIGFGHEFAWLIQLLRLPVVILFVAVAAESVYWLAPNRWKAPRLAGPGALVFGAGWALFTVGFAFYVTHLGSYNATYGALAGVVILLFWFYVSSLLLLFGAEINALVEARSAPPLPVSHGSTHAVHAARAQSAALEWAMFAGAALALVAFVRGFRRVDSNER